MKQNSKTKQKKLVEEKEQDENGAIRKKKEMNSDWCVNTVSGVALTARQISNKIRNIIFNKFKL